MLRIKEIVVLCARQIQMCNSRAWKSLNLQSLQLEIFSFPDIDECDELRVDCGAGKRCFNRRGDYECLDITCPENYDRDPSTGWVCFFVCRSFSKNVLENAHTCMLEFFIWTKQRKKTRQRRAVSFFQGLCIGVLEEWWGVSSGCKICRHSYISNGSVTKWHTCIPRLNPTGSFWSIPCSSTSDYIHYHWKRWPSTVQHTSGGRKGSVVHPETLGGKVFVQNKSSSQIIWQWEERCAISNNIYHFHLCVSIPILRTELLQLRFRKAGCPLGQYWHTSVHLMIPPSMPLIQMVRHNKTEWLNTTRRAAAVSLHFRTMLLDQDIEQIRSVFCTVPFLL